MFQGLLSFKGRYRTLNLAWFAFFLTFVCWFTLAPFLKTVAHDLHLNPGQAKTLLACNLALTIPARIIIGMLLDRFGPRITFSGLLIYAALPALGTAFAQDFNQMVWSRLAMGIVGAGFVVGIRLVAEWFPPKEIGFAQGIYGGWGNFGSFAAEAVLPTIAVASGFLAAGHVNWRFAIGLTGIVTAIYGIFFYFTVQNTPPGKAYQRPARNGGMEVTSKTSLWALLATNIPLFGALALLTWRLEQVKFLNATAMYGVWAFLVALYVFQAYQIWQVNREVASGIKQYPPEDRYKIGQVFLLELAYAASFGSELAVVSMLPTFVENTFHVSEVVAGPIAATYPLMNLVSRPAGGFISDKIGSRKWTLAAMLGGLGVGYLLMSRISGGWPLPLVIVLTMCCAFFVFGGAGATFGIAPLIKRRVTGQIAGNVGAYGSVGSVIYTTIYSLLPKGSVGGQQFFEVLGVGGLVAFFLCALLLKEPQVVESREFADDAAMVGH